jgi:DNA-binding CsgD family transcriptional regulator
MDAAPSKAHEVLPPDATVDPTVEDLLRQLLERTGEQVARGRGPPDHPQRQEVVLGVYLDGVSYTLIRSPAYSPHTEVTLSPREQEIVRLVAKGLPNKAIAEVLDMSLWTVATHLRRVFAKLGVNSRAEMIAHVLEEGLLPAKV